MALPDVATLVSLANDDAGVPGATFRDAGDNEFRLALPFTGAPVLQRFVPHRYTDKLAGDHHAYVTREDTPLTWEEAATLADRVAALSGPGHDASDALIRDVARRAGADGAWCADASVKALLQSTSQVLFPAGFGKRLVTLESRAQDGDSPLHVLLWRKDEAGARRLVEAGADVDAAGDLQDTPLHVALRFKLADAVAMLLAAGANPDAPNVFGDMPRAAAYKQGGAMADCLRSAGLDPPPPSPPPVDAPE
jgi:hypothetical protein